MQNEVVEVLSPEKIKQKLAGYLANYNRRINNSVNSKERKILEANREGYMKSCEEKINEENKKAIQRRAGYLSWETRRKNEAAKKSADSQKTVRNVGTTNVAVPKNPRRRYSSSIDVQVINSKRK